MRLQACSAVSGVFGARVAARKIFGDLAPRLCKVLCNAGERFEFTFGAGRRGSYV